MMNSIKVLIKNDVSKLSFGVIALTIIFFRLTFPYGNPINYDVFGYYLYLPFAFIYQDLGFENYQQLKELFNNYEPSNSLYQIAKGPNGQWMMKYSMGMAILYSPFFLLSHLFALLSPYAADGFSVPYQWGIRISSTVYSLIGVFFLRKVLRVFFNEKVSAITLLIVFFGTNYFDQSLFNAESSHNYLFTLYAMVLWFTIQWHKEHKLKSMLFLAISIGLLILSRPTEILAVIIPLLWGVSDLKSLRSKFGLFIQYRKQILLFSLLVTAIVFLQLIYWKTYSGQFVFYSYTNPGEGFDFLAPHTLKALFSFRKGWLIYTPVMAFSILGFYFVFKNNRYIFFSLFIFFVINLYVVSSWSCWWYANCFSQRALVQSYAIMSIPLGYFIMHISESKKLFKWIFYCLILFFIWLNLFQTWQMRNRILSGDRMTFAYYQKVFARTDVSPEDQKLLLVDRWLEGDEILRDETLYEKRQLLFDGFESTTAKYKNYHDSSYAYEGVQSFHFDSSILYRDLYLSSFDELTNSDHGWIRTEFQLKIGNDVDLNDFLLVMTFKHKDKSYKYRAFKINQQLDIDDLVSNDWQKISFDYLTPEVRSKKDLLHIYFWNKGKGEVIIDNVVLSVFERRND